MTNKDEAFGARIFNFITSAKFDLRTNKYTTDEKDAEPIFVGDAVKSTGTSDNEGIPIITKVTSQNDPILGFVNSIEPALGENTKIYRVGNSKRLIHVCDDPFIKFEMQVNGEFSETDVFKNANLAIGSGEPATGLSTTQIDASSITTENAQIKILGLSEKPTNELGQYAKVECIVIKHEVAPYENSAFWQLDGNNLQPIVDGHDINSRTGNFYGNNDKFNSEDKTISGSFNTTLTTTHSCGRISGGEIKVQTPLPSTLIDIEAGSGYFRKTNADDGELVELDWPELKNQNIPLGVVKYIGVSYNAGSPIIVLKDSDSWNLHTEFPLGSVVNEQNTLHTLNNPWRAIDPISFITERFYETRPFERADRIGGLLIGETGTRNVTVSGGELYDATNEFHISNIDTSVSDVFDSYLGSTYYAGLLTQWDNNNYNNGGVLTALNTNWYANLWWYIEADNNLLMVYGTGQYATAAGAEGEKVPSDIPDRIKVHGRLLGRFIFRKGGATTTLIESAFEEDFSGTTTGSHSNLSNLSYAASGHQSGFDGFQQGTTLSTSDPTVNDDDVKGYFIGDLWTNTASKTSFTLLDDTTGAAVWNKIYSSLIGTNYIVNGFTFPSSDGSTGQVMYTNGSGQLDFKTLSVLDQLRTFYVSKAGNDGFSGRNIDAPFLTIAKALTEAALLSPTSANPVLIKIIDGAVYTENVPAQSFVIIDARNAIIKGKYTYIGNSVLIVDQIQSNLDHCCQSSATLGETAYICTRLIKQTSDNKYGINATTAVGLHVNINEILTNGNACRGVNISSFAVEGRINKIFQPAGSSFGIYMNSNGTTVNLQINSGITTTGTGIFLSNGTLLLKTNRISGLNAYNVTGGELILDTNKLSGTTIKSGGTVRSIRNDLMGARQLTKRMIEERTYKAFPTAPAIPPDDDTPPTTSEGAELFTVTHTTSGTASDTIRVDLHAIVHLSSNVIGGYFCCVIFKDSDTVPIGIGCNGTGQGADSQEQAICRTTTNLTGGTTYTFKIRGGTNATGVWFNGNPSSRRYGGTLVSSITIEEYEVI